MSNLEHAGIVHSDIWLPLVLWSFVELKTKFTATWFAIATLSIASLIFGGQTGVVAFDDVCGFLDSLRAAASRQKSTQTFLPDLPLHAYSGWGFP